MLKVIENDNPPRRTIVLCASEQERSAIKELGYKSIRVVSQVESLYVPSAETYELDPSLSFFDDFVLAYPRELSDLRDDIAMRIGDVKCRWVDFRGASNATELPTDILSNELVSARRMWVDEICTMDDVAETHDQVFETGIKGLDDLGLRLTKPAFMPVIGPYGSGKSVLLRQLAVSLYKKHGWRTLMTAFEEKIKPRFQRDLRRHMINRPMNQWTDADVARADAEINRAFRFLRRKRGAELCQQRLMDRIAYAVQVYGVDVVIIDPVNELDHDVPKGMSKTDYMGKFIMNLKQLADDYGLLMIVAAHPPKDGVEKKFAKGRLLTLNDGADTAHFGNKADIGWCVWRPTFADGSPTLLHVDKVKDHETMGKPNLIELHLDQRMNRFQVGRSGYDLIGDYM